MKLLMIVVEDDVSIVDLEGEEQALGWVEVENIEEYNLDKPMARAHVVDEVVRALDQATRRKDG